MGGYKNYPENFNKNTGFVEKKKKVRLQMYRWICNYKIKKKKKVTGGGFFKLSQSNT